MKTREEIQRELDAKKEITPFQAFKTELESVLKAFLSQLRKENVKVEVKHGLNEISEINSLKMAIKELNIPKEVVIKQEIKHTTDKVSHRFLWWYFAVSSLVTCLAVAIAIYSYTNSQEITEKAKKEGFMQGKIQGQKNVYQVLPKSSQKYLKDKYPDAFGNYE